DVSPSCLRCQPRTNFDLFQTSIGVFATPFVAFAGTERYIVATVAEQLWLAHQSGVVGVARQSDQKVAAYPVDVGQAGAARFGRQRLPGVAGHDRSASNPARALARPERAQHAAERDWSTAPADLSRCQ